MEAIKYLGESESFRMDKDGKFVRNQKVHLAKGVRLFAFGYAMSEQQFVVCNDDMIAVEICTGSPSDICEEDLDRYFSARHPVSQDIRPISEKFGIGFYYDESGELVDDETIRKSIERADNLDRLRQEVKERKEKERLELIDRLKEKYSYLERTGNGTKEHIVCGRNIRAELKRNFPNVKFSVRYESFSGGDAYEISWTDGPMTKDVDAIVDKYQDKHPDEYSQGDYWDYSPSEFNHMYGGVSYIRTYRRMSDEAQKMIGEKIGSDSYDTISREFYETDLTPVKEEVNQDIADADVSLKIIDYSERAIAVVGDTKSVSSTLKSLGGKFNSRLSCGAGWIFSKKREDDVRKALNIQ